MVVDEIRESSIAQGDLVLIINNKRPTKSGFWRKVREGDTKNGTIYYILEKPIHKDYDPQDEDICFTHSEQGLFVMSDKTVRADYQKFEYNKEKTKYNIIADIRGVDVVKLVKNNYNLDTISINSKNVKVTEDYLSFKDIYDRSRNDKKISVLESVAMHCI